MKTTYNALDICNARLNAQDTVIAHYKQELATMNDAQLFEQCQQYGIEMRANAFATRCALVLAKKNELHNFEIQGRKNNLESMGIASKIERKV